MTKTKRIENYLKGSRKWHTIFDISNALDMPCYKAEQSLNLLVDRGLVSFREGKNHDLYKSKV